MTSHFATGTSRRNSPAWCKKGMFSGIDPTINGRPATATAYAQWTGVDSGGSYSVIESFQLRRNDAGNGWSGHSSTTGSNLSIEILDTADPNFVDVHLHLRIDTALRNSIQWWDVPTTYHRAWGTQMLTTPVTSENQRLQTQILA